MQGANMLLDEPVRLTSVLTPVKPVSAAPPPAPPLSSPSVSVHFRSISRSMSRSAARNGDERRVRGTLHLWGWWILNRFFCFGLVGSVFDPIWCAGEGWGSSRCEIHFVRMRFADEQRTCRIRGEFNVACCYLWSHDYFKKMPYIFFHVELICIICNCNVGIWCVEGLGVVWLPWFWHVTLDWFDFDMSQWIDFEHDGCHLYALSCVLQKVFPSLTKIVGTLGPNSHSVEVIQECLTAGMAGWTRFSAGGLLLICFPLLLLRKMMMLSLCFVLQSHGLISHGWMLHIIRRPLTIWGKLHKMSISCAL